MSASLTAKVPFADEKHSQQFLSEMWLLLSREIDRRRAMHIPDGNVHIFQHGTGWTFQRTEKEGYSTQTGQLQLHGESCTISVDRVMANDLSLVPEFVNALADLFDGTRLKLMLATAQRAAEENGNTISIPKEGPTEQGVLDIIEGMTLTVADDGTVERPTIFLNEETRQVWEKGQTTFSPSFAQQIEDLWMKKENEARQREADRIARYQNE